MILFKYLYAFFYSTVYSSRKIFTNFIESSHRSFRWSTEFETANNISNVFTDAPSFADVRSSAFVEISFFTLWLNALFKYSFGAMQAACVITLRINFDVGFPGKRIACIALIIFWARATVVSGTFFAWLMNLNECSRPRITLAKCGFESLNYDSILSMIKLNALKPFSPETM